METGGLTINRRPQTVTLGGDFGLLVESLLAAAPAELLNLHLLFLFLASGEIVIFVLAARARQDEYLAIRARHYSVIEPTTPAPTVWPPSRTANLKPCSIATGVINSTSMSMLSPGITISTPSGSVIEPVTSVVLK